MTDYSELVEALRILQDKNSLSYYKRQVCKDAAAAIEALQAEIKRLKEANDELREAQTYIDHYGDKWMTSAKDVPTSAYEHGYADGFDEAEAQLPKLGEWKPFDLTYGRSVFYCSVCEQATEVPMCMEKPMYAYCPNCGAKMEVQE